MTELSAASQRELRILDAIRRIPRGKVLGYGDVARLAGFPGRARLVARILASGAHPELPWHRVLRSDGRIAFPAGSPEWVEQSQRLRAEGVDVKEGRVRRSAADPAEDLDRLIWGG